MFGLMFKSTHEAETETLRSDLKTTDEALAQRNRELGRERADRIRVGAALKEALAERDAAREELAQFKAARARTNANLKQFRKPANGSANGAEAA